MRWFILLVCLIAKMYGALKETDHDIELVPCTIGSNYTGVITKADVPACGLHARGQLIELKEYLLFTLNYVIRTKINNRETLAKAHILHCTNCMAIFQTCLQGHQNHPGLCTKLERKTLEQAISSSHYASFPREEVLALHAAWYVTEYGQILASGMRMCDTCNATVMACVTQVYGCDIKGILTFIMKSLSVVDGFLYGRSQFNIEQVIRIAYELHILLDSVTCCDYSLVHITTAPLDRNFVMRHLLDASKKQLERLLIAQSGSAHSGPRSVEYYNIDKTIDKQKEFFVSSYIEKNNTNINRAVFFTVMISLENLLMPPVKSFAALCEIVKRMCLGQWKNDS